MDFLTLLSYFLAIVETAALIGTLVYVTRAMHEKKLLRATQGKKGAVSKEQVDQTVKLHYRNAGIFFTVYIVLNFIRNFSGIFD